MISEAETRARGEGPESAEISTAARAIAGQMTREQRAQLQTRGKRRMVAVVVSAASSEAQDSYEDDAAYHA